MSTTEITLLPPADNLPALFADPASLDQTLAEIENKVRGFVPNLSTVTTRKEISSLAYKVARSKTALDEAGKSLTERMRADISVIDGRRKTIRDRLDGLRDEVRKPLEEWEAAEEARVEAHKARLTDFANATRGLHEAVSSAVAEQLVWAENVDTGPEWEEFREQAVAAKAKAVDDLRDLLERRQRHEAEQRELAEFRAAKERREAEEQAAEATRRAEAERAAQEEAIRQREERIAEAARARAEREAQERVEAAERAQREAEVRAERQKQEAEAAVLREQERQAREREETAKADARRAANKRHVAAVRAEISAAIAKVMDASEGGYLHDRIADALMAGTIPHTKVTL